ncbi:MAG: hypothetical protein JXP37_07020 [Coriobacteriia bacterium]|nr:hypothetical protein [Coriobacteriia bacterium]
MEIAAVAADVLPDYEGRIVFIDALTTDTAAAPVLQRYRTRYIPTSIFVDSSGQILETYVGPLTEAQIREKLAELL